MELCFDGVGKRLIQDKPFWVIAYKRRIGGRLDYGSKAFSVESQAIGDMKYFKKNEARYVSYLHIRLYSVHDEVYELVEDWRK